MSSVNHPGDRLPEAADIAFFSSISKECGQAFVSAEKQARALLSESAYATWVSLARKIHRSFPDTGDPVRAYLDSSRPFFCEDGFGYLKNWVTESIKIGSWSTACAKDFLMATPAFLAHARFAKINQLASDTKYILDAENGCEATASAFIKTSATTLRYLSPRVYKIWKESGLRILRQNRDRGTQYFSMEPEGLDRLYLSEATKIFKITAIAFNGTPAKAGAFYETLPNRILRVNPNLRDKILEKILEMASGRPDEIIEDMNAMALSLGSFSNPVQQTIFDLGKQLDEISKKAFRAYYQNVKSVLENIPVYFLVNWVSRGMDLLLENKKEGVTYFAMESPEAGAELVKWGSAAFLEQNREMLSLFCHALCGKKVRIRSNDEMAESERNRLGLIAEDTGFIFFLSPYVAEEDNAAANIRYYKTAAALKSGYVEFGTLAPEFAGIWQLLESFPDRELALDIFHTLEDGRVFYNLKKNYPGLSPEIERTIENALLKRDVPREDLFGAALEVLLRLSLGYSADINMDAPFSKSLAGVCADLEGHLANFPAQAETVLDSYKTTARVYDTLSALARQTPRRAALPLALRMNKEPEESEGTGPMVMPPDTIVEGDGSETGADITLTPEELERLLDMAQDITLLSMLTPVPSANRFYLSDLDNFTVKDGGDEARDQDGVDIKQGAATGKTVGKAGTGKKKYYYDEWDFLANEYRTKWCCLREKEPRQSDPDMYHRIYAEYGDLIRKARAQFQRIRPASLDIIHNVDQGDEIDLTALIRHVVDKKAGAVPSDRVFCRKDKKIRHMSTLLLIDMSASTEETASEVSAEEQQDKGGKTPRDNKRVIDIEKESLIVMSEALDALGDQYAMYGFSGHGREQVDYYVIKPFDESNTEKVKMRICGIEPRQSTRMGTAIRHAVSKLSNLEADHRLLILLSDGFPQDLDYGEDRNSREYGINDTMMAFIEAKRLGIKPFCITIDQSGNDYLKKMCAPEEYLIIKDIAMLPELLPGIVESLMG